MLAIFIGSSLQREETFLGQQIVEDARTFYMDVNFVSNTHTSNVPVHLAAVKIGDQTLNLWISLQEQSLSVVSESCTDCATSVKYNAFSAGKYENGSYPCVGGDKKVIYLDGSDPDNTEIL